VSRCWASRGAIDGTRRLSANRYFRRRGLGRRGRGGGGSGLGPPGLIDRVLRVCHMECQLGFLSAILSEAADHRAVDRERAATGAV